MVLFFKKSNSFIFLIKGKVPLKKVNFNAKQEYEYIANFKVLQKVFDELRIDKVTFFFQIIVFKTYCLLKKNIYLLIIESGYRQISERQISR